MVDLLDEVRDELKDERALQFIKQHGTFILVLMVVSIFGAALKLWWNDYQENKAYHAGGEYMSAIMKMRAYKPEEAVKKFEELFTTNNTNYGALAGLNAGSYSDFKKDYDKSYMIYKNVSENSSYDKSLRDLSKYLELKTALSTNKEEAIAGFEKYTQEGIYKFSALELLGTYYLQQGNKEKAKEAFNTILTDPESPTSLKKRVGTLLVMTN